MKTRRIWVAITAIMALPCLLQATVVYTCGSSDGVATREQWMGGSSTGVNSSGESLAGYYWYMGGADRLFSYPVMQFSLAEFKNIEDTADLTATLGFYVIKGSNLNNSYVRFYDGDGTGTVTYAQGTGGSKVGNNLTSAGWQSIDVTDQFKTALSKGYDWITFNLAMPTYDMDVAVVSSEGATGNYEGLAPQIAVVIPEPATMIILGLGSLPLLRRKK